MSPKTRGGLTKKGTSKEDLTSKASSSTLLRYAVSESDSGSESENEATLSKDKEDSDTLPMQPLKFFFQQTQYNLQCKIQTRCDLSDFLEIIEGFKPELELFKKHPQFKHFFHMEKEPNRKLQGLWMLLLRTVCVDRNTIVWFVVNGVPIRYSLREHGLISGLNCHDYPNGINPKMKLKTYTNQFKERQFRNKKTITIKDVKDKLLSMKKSSPDRLKMAILYFLSTVLGGKVKVNGNIDPFLLRMAEDPDLCKSYPWERMTFEDSVKDVYHVMKHMNGSAAEKLTFPGFVIPLEILAFECIPKLRKSFREDVEEVEKECPRMCNILFLHFSTN